jgi:TrmH family RNA methyltransferase
MEITSPKNARIKHLTDLQEKSRNRRKEGLFVIEGPREIKLALAGGYVLEEIYNCTEIESEEKEQVLGQIAGEVLQFSISLPVYQKIAYRSTVGGLVAVARAKPLSLENLTLSKNPLILVCEGVEKPGNLGALLRTADATQLDAFIICDPKADFYNPNVIRSSVGCVFTQAVAAAGTAETIAFLKKNNIATYACELEAAQRYDQPDYTRPTAFIMGTEATGLSREWLSAADQNIIIPMRGQIDSLNVSVSAAVVVFEAGRQRGFC